MFRGPRLAGRSGLQVRYCPECHFAHLENSELPQDYYENDKFYKEFSVPDWFLKESLEHKMGLWNSRYKFESDFLSKSYPLLDIGCGSGWFLAYWGYHGGLGYGIEPSDSARTWSRTRYQIYPNLETLKPRLITPMHLRLSLVLEHIKDPRSFLKNYLHLLGDKGRLIVCVPNEFNPLQNQLRDKYGDWFVQAPHLNYFSRASLRNLMLELGLRPVYEGASFPMELFALAGISYVGNDTLGRKCHLARLRLEKFWGPNIFKVYGLLYRKLGWGRESICVYEKA